MVNSKLKAMNTDQMVRAVSAPIDNRLSYKSLTLRQELDTCLLPLQLQNRCIDWLDFIGIDYLPDSVTGLPAFEFNCFEKLFCASISSYTSS